jgi:hypothetical protein
MESSRQLSRLEAVWRHRDRFFNHSARSRDPTVSARSWTSLSRVPVKSSCGQLVTQSSCHNKICRLASWPWWVDRLKSWPAPFGLCSVSGPQSQVPVNSSHGPLITQSTCLQRVDCVKSWPAPLGLGILFSIVGTRFVYRHTSVNLVDWLLSCWAHNALAQSLENTFSVSVGSREFTVSAQSRHLSVSARVSGPHCLVSRLVSKNVSTPSL